MWPGRAAPMLGLACFGGLFGLNDPTVPPTMSIYFAFKQNDSATFPEVYGNIV